MTVLIINLGSPPVKNVYSQVKNNPYDDYKYRAFTIKLCAMKTLSTTVSAKNNKNFRNVCRNFVVPRYCFLEILENHHL